jgi:uracil-DNA glycosylase
MRAVDLPTAIEGRRRGVPRSMPTIIALRDPVCVSNLRGYDTHPTRIDEAPSRSRRERAATSGGHPNEGPPIAAVSGKMTEIDETASAAALIPKQPTLDRLREAATECAACPLYRNATQTVFGEGPERAAMMLVGEQPGDSEDLAGHPFVGAAGELLDRCLEAAGIDRGRAYVTNAVKHFKWVPRGTRRIHSKPGSLEIAACFPWLEAEIAALQPRIIVALGATAAQALFGKAFRVTRDRGRLMSSPWAPYALATVHPSALLRAPDEETRHRETERFIADLKQAATVLQSR